MVTWCHVSGNRQDIYRVGPAQNLGIGTEIFPDFLFQHGLSLGLAVDQVKRWLTLEGPIPLDQLSLVCMCRKTCQPSKGNF